MARIARTREGHPHHTALLGEWAIGKTTLLMHWRRLLRDLGDAVVLTLAYPQPVGDFLDGLRLAIEADPTAGADQTRDVEVGVSLGLATAKVRQSFGEPAPQVLRAAIERLAKRQHDRNALASILVDDIDLLAGGRDVLLRLRAICLELYANDLPIALVVAATPSLFAGVGSAHESLIRYYEPLTLGPLDEHDTERAIAIPLQGTGVTFEPKVLADMARASAGRPYYLQKLAYHAFDAAVDGHVGEAEYGIGFERAFATVSQEIFVGRWNAMAPSEQAVVRLLADGNEPLRSRDVEGLARRAGVAPPATRQALRRLAAAGHIRRLANGRRGRYEVADPLFRRYLEMQSP